MVYSVFVSDCVKVLRGTLSVLSATKVIQANEIKIFLRLVGLRDCARDFGQLRPATVCDIEKRNHHHNNCICTTFPNLSNKTRSFSTSIPISSESPPRKAALSSSKERRVPSTRIGRAAGFGSMGWV